MDAAALQLFDISKYLDRHCINILDESDEVLNPKYQVQYTLGSHLPTHGGVERWKIIATVLKIASDVANKMRADETFDADVIELVGAKVSPQVETKAFFRPIRLLDHERQAAAYENMKARVVKCVTEMYQEGLSSEEKRAWTRVVLFADTDKGESLSKLSESHKNQALLMRGLLSHEILRKVLTKRFRVNYGAHPQRPGCRMAVPYTAKDVAAPRTEFQQPDLAIALTFLTYY
ncbi:unnamed protein product, partial [Amoebophrya sp. A25]|eukprot:GSA25T00011894001.1